MRKIFIDFSLTVEEVAFGRISGTIAVPLIPSIGDQIIFDFYGFDLPNILSDAFSGISQVESRSIVANRGLEDALFCLANFSVPNSQAARSLMSSFEAHYGLFGEPYELEAQ